MMTSAQATGLLLLLSFPQLQGAEPRSGFEPSEWHPLSENAHGNVLEPTRMVLSAAGGYHHPQLLPLQLLEFQADFNTSDRGGFTIGLFTTADPAAASPVTISFSHWGNRLWISADEPSLKLGGEDAVMADHTLKVRIELMDQSIKVSIDDLEVLSVPFSAEKRSGTGLRFATGSSFIPIAEVPSVATITVFKTE